MNLVVNYVDIFKYVWETFGAVWTLVSIGLALLVGNKIGRILVNAIDQKFFRY